MKKSLLLILFIIFTTTLPAQTDTVKAVPGPVQKNALADAASANITIYPVPVKQNYFTIRSDRAITGIRVTNIIGQDIFKIKYNTSETLPRILLDNPRRGMYLVTITLADGSRVVKKVMIEQAE